MRHSGLTWQYIASILILIGCIDWILPRSEAAELKGGTTSTASAPHGEQIPLVDAIIFTPGEIGPRHDTALEFLLDEVEKRTRIRWPVASEWPLDHSRPVIVFGLTAHRGELSAHLPDSAISAESPGAEGYQLQSLQGEDGETVILALGADERGAFFVAGRLLRELHMKFDELWLPGPPNIVTTPKYPLRGHQLGFRPKVHSYDAWAPAQFEQYYRDLMVFGTNAIELIPPRSDDEDDSPHFPLTKIEMMARMSEIADQYGLDVWIWYPAMDADYADPATVEFALNEWGAVFDKLPRIDHVFVPGGDPGHTQPHILLDMMKRQTDNLHRRHPNAKMWLSPQSFSHDWMEEFFQIMETAPPDWLTGIVFGPQNRTGLPELRRRVPQQFPIRRYPDITHSIRCQYPVEDWDYAYITTEHREVINPRPEAYRHIFRLWDELSNGFLTYSEGVNDDVNKIVWSCLGWDPDLTSMDILRQYARYYVGPDYEYDYAQGLLDLEKNWRGPLISNTSVENTLARFQVMERAATPQTLRNWRFQQGLYRAYYDAYNRRRLIYETDLENQVADVLRQAYTSGAELAMEDAESILAESIRQPVARDLRARISELAEALYQSINMQLSVEKYKAIHWGRGANLDLIDMPLNNRIWLLEQFDEVRQLATERERLARLDAIVNWSNPGPGGFYDDLGDATNQSHLVRGTDWVDDPEFRDRSRMGFEFTPGARTSWNRFAEGRYNSPVQLHYENLNPAAQYKVQAIYGGEIFTDEQGRTTQIRLDADGLEVHDFIDKKRPLERLEFHVPREATADGAVTLQWSPLPGFGGPGRGCQISEVWLIDASPGKPAATLKPRNLINDLTE